MANGVTEFFPVAAYIGMDIKEVVDLLGDSWQMTTFGGNMTHISFCLALDTSHT